MLLPRHTQNVFDWYCISLLTVIGFCGIIFIHGGQWLWIINILLVRGGCKLMGNSNPRNPRTINWIFCWLCIVCYFSSVCVLPSCIHLLFIVVYFIVPCCTCICRPGLYVQAVYPRAGGAEDHVWVHQCVPQGAGQGHRVRGGRGLQKRHHFCPGQYWISD